MPMGKLTEVQEEVLGRAGRFRPVHESLEVKEVVVGEGERRRRYIVCRNLVEAGVSASTVRRCWRHYVRNWRGLTRRPPTTPSGPASWLPRSATAAI